MTRARSFQSFCKAAGLWINQGNKFNIKPPNRVDYVFTYACTNGQGGGKGNKTMSFEQFLFALKGIAKETGFTSAEVEEMAGNASVQNASATKAQQTRFHDDTSNYTGAYKQQHADLKGEALSKDKAAIRRNRSLKALDGDALLQAQMVENTVELVFNKYDADGSGFLDKAELKNALMGVNPELDAGAAGFAAQAILREDNDGKLTLEEFKKGWNLVIDFAKLMEVRACARARPRVQPRAARCAAGARPAGGAD